MTGFEAFNYYVSLKLHFSNPAYDFFKFKGKVKNSNIETFESRNDRFQFEKLAKKVRNDKNFVGYLVANFIVKPNIWIGELNSPECHEIFEKWKGKIQSLSFVFTEDFGIMMKEVGDAKEFNRLFLIENDLYPPILKMVHREEINLETFIILDKILGFTKRYDETFVDDTRWKLFKMKCVKYEPFLDLDLNIYEEIARKKLTGEM